MFQIKVMEPIIAECTAGPLRHYKRVSDTRIKNLRP